MTKLRVLMLAPDCNPESVTTPQIAYAHAEALAKLHDVTLVVRSANEHPIKDAGGEFSGVHSVRLPGIDEFYAWAMRSIFKYDYGRQSLTAATYPLQVAFEWRAWRQLRKKIKDGEFDVVIRILPIVTVLPSPFAYFLRNGPIPFVIGPQNGGLPWPEGFPQLDVQRQQAGYWVHYLRELYRYLPFARSTYSKAAAIIAGSSHTHSEFSEFGDKLFFVAGENGLDAAIFEQSMPSKSDHGSILRLVFVGRLIPLKACDLAIRATAGLLSSGRAEFTVVGDGPEMERLRALVKELAIEDAVRFTGWVTPVEAQNYMRLADVFVFPSLREFGGAVVFEALGLGAVPVVADFGGPGDIVTSEVGYKLSLVNEHVLMQQLESVINELANDRGHLDTLRHNGVAYAREHLTWDGKASAVSKVLYWVTGKGPKPDLPAPTPAKLEVRRAPN